MTRSSPLAAALAMLAGLLTQAADWPTWRADPTRSGATTAPLPETLSLRWSRKLPPPQPAWPLEPRLQFDAAYEPVVAGKMLFLASPLQDTVSAFDTDTGNERWTFFAAGPARFAPAAWNDRVYVVSDDGFLYCLDAATGSIVWRFRGSPQPERTHLGNGRLVSFWAARGGPVVAEGVVYFAAGIWPSLGVYIHAVNAENGQAVWANADTDLMPDTRIDHNALKDAGLSPQGYLVVVGDALLVPNGRSMPAVLDRKTGRVRNYVQGYRSGHCRVVAMGRYALVGADAVVDLATGREVGSRHAAAGADAPKAFDLLKVHLFEGPFLPYKFLPGCSSWSVLAADAVYGMQQATLYGYDLTQPKVTEYERKEADGRLLKPWRWDLPELWNLKMPKAPSNAPCRTLIRAGNRLYGHVGADLIAVNLPQAATEAPTIAWTQSVPAVPASLAAADDKLFVTTTDGRLLCLAAASEVQPLTPAVTAAPLPPTPDAWTAMAAHLLKSTGVTDGYGLVLGVDSDRLLDELLNQSQLHLIVVAADPSQVAALRRRFLAAGLYGSRIECQCGNPAAFPFPPYLASLVVSAAATSAELATPAALPGLCRVLRPYGGVACVALDDAGHARLQQTLAARPQEAAELSRADGFSLLRRVGPLPGSAAWTHESCDAARSYYSTDDRVRAPLGVLWYGHGEGPQFSQINDYDSGVKPQVVGGRLFALRQNPPLLFAMDVYTGRVLWTQAVDRLTRYASMPDGIFVAGNGTCTVYDPATGANRAAYPLEIRDAEGRPPLVRSIRVGADTVVVGLGFDTKGGVTEEPWDCKALVALDRATGKLIWSRTAQQRINHQALALGDGLLFCIDSLSPTIAGRDLKQGQSLPDVESLILALDLRTGTEKWHATEKRPAIVFMLSHWPSQRSNDDWLAYAAEPKVVLAGRGATATAYQAGTGEPLWTRRIGAQPLIIEGKTFLNQNAERFEVLTGKPLGGNPLLAQRHGCNYMVGARHLLMLRDASASYADTDTDTRYWLRNLRSGCSSSMIPADGVLSLPFFSSACVCNYPLQTSLALVSMPEMAAWAHGKKLTPPAAAVPAPAAP